MIITIVALAIDCIILSINDQSLLSLHSVYIVHLVVRLWRYKQPESYMIREQKGKSQPNENQGEENQNQLRWCSVCSAFKPERYYHCRRCNKCIYRMDHHCNWVSNCIGQYNAKVYLHLLTNMLLHSLIVILVIIYNYDSLIDASQYRIYYLITVFPALYFCFESYRLIHDFWTSVKKNQTLIESYKKVYGPKIETFQSWIAYMGPSPIGWFIPTFISHERCDLLQKVIVPANEQIKEYDDPQDYIYGTDEEEDAELLRQQ